MDSKRVPTSDTERARSLLAAGRQGEAMALLEAVLQVNPGSAEAHAMLGSALAAGGDRENSLAHFERACALDPERASYRFNLGYASEGAGNFARARQEYQAALQLEPAYRRAAEGLERVQAASQLTASADLPAFEPTTIVTPAVHAGLQSSPVTGSVSAWERGPELVRDVDGVRSAADPPDVVHWLGVMYALLAGVSALLFALNLVGLIAALGRSTPDAMHRVMGETILSVALVAVFFGLYRGFECGARSAWYGQIAVCILAFLSLPLVRFDTLMLLFPVGGGLILYHWFQPLVKEWFEVGS